MTDIETTVLKEGTMLAILPEHHPLSQNGLISLEILEKEPFILLDENHYVEAGLSVSILAKLVLHLTNYKIRLCATEPPISGTIAIGYRDKSSLPIACKRFIALLRSHLDKLP